MTSNQYGEQLPLLSQCTERESGGTRCEAWLIQPDEPHHHFITEETVRERLGR